MCSVRPCPGERQNTFSVNVAVSCMNSWFEEEQLAGRLAYSQCDVPYKQLKCNVCVELHFSSTSTY